MILRNPLRFIAAVATMISLSFAAQAGIDTNTSLGGTTKGAGLALHGYDAVGYFTEGKAIRGLSKFALVHNEATYRFVSKENMKTFQKHPKKYAPQYGGFCAFGASVGKKFDGDPEYWRIVDGKLYLNLNGEIQQTWLKDIPANLKKANKNWKEIANVHPNAL